MNAKELTLNIAVNLGRLGRWASEGRVSRVNQFLAQTEEYISELESAPKSLRFSKTFEVFRKSFSELRGAERFDATWQEMMFTWANILTHRASLNA